MRALALAAVLLLAGCAEPIHSTDPAALETLETLTSPTDPGQAQEEEEVAGGDLAAMTPEQFAAAAGVEGYTPGELAPGATSYGEGTLDGAKVQVYRFDTDEGYTMFAELVREWGIADELLRFEPWAVSCSRDTGRDTECESQIGANLGVAATR
jgi:hypothetical protein